MAKDFSEKITPNDDEAAYVLNANRMHALGGYVRAMEGLGITPGNEVDLPSEFCKIREQANTLENGGNIRQVFIDSYERNYGPVARRMEKYQGGQDPTKKDSKPSEKKPNWLKKLLNKNI